MACEVLQDGGSEPFCFDVQTLARNYDKKWLYNIITQNTAYGKIILDQGIKTRYGWVVSVNLICKKIGEKAHALKEESEVLMEYQTHKDTNKLHIDLGHPLKEFMQATGKE